MKKPLIVIVGPTAVGKTAASIEVAKTFGGEIINGDAFQVYRGLDIGTAKVSKEEQAGIPHHLIDIREPTDTYSAAQFRRDAFRKITEIDGRGHVPVIVGGTGMYIKGITSDWSFNDVAGDDQFRERLEARGQEEGGAQKLHEALARHDPDAAQRIHPRNARKIIRALELIYAGKSPPAPVARDDGQPHSHQVMMIGLTMERSQLYERIEARVEHMLAEGLLSEVSALYEAGIRHTQAMRGIGYKELVAYLDGDCSFEEAVAQLKRHSRRFAKRQLTWFRNKENVTWFEVREGEEKKVSDKICTHLAGKLANTSKDY